MSLCSASLAGIVQKQFPAIWKTRSEHVVETAASGEAPCTLGNSIPSRKRMRLISECRPNLVALSFSLFRTMQRNCRQYALHLCQHSLDHMHWAGLSFCFKMYSHAETPGLCEHACFSEGTPSNYPQVLVWSIHSRWSPFFLLSNTVGVKRSM